MKGNTMWSEMRISDDLRELGLREGMSALVHVSLDALGPVEGGSEALVRAFRSVLGGSGTVLVPTFTTGAVDPDEWDNAPSDAGERERLRQLIEPFDVTATPADREQEGLFGETVRAHPDALRSDHPLVSFAALGPNAEFLTRHAPFHYPLGSESPLARLHQLDGVVVLIGLHQRANHSLHLAEVWAEVPYIHRSLSLKTGQMAWSVMKGRPECSEGFERIEPLLNQSRILRRGYVGNAESRFMRQRALISMGVAILQGDATSLLCTRPDCRWCILARKQSEPTRSGIRPTEERL